MRRLIIVALLVAVLGGALAAVGMMEPPWNCTILPHPPMWCPGNML